MNIHARRAPDGTLHYRLWSPGKSKYITSPLTQIQVRKILLRAELDKAIELVEARLDTASKTGHSHGITGQSKLLEPWNEEE